MDIERPEREERWIERLKRRMIERHKRQIRYREESI
jgi:inactivated superfamily I helicase